MKAHPNLHFLRSVCATAGVLLLAACTLAQTNSGPRIGVIHQHGFAGVVSSISGSTIVMEIPENVSFTVQIGPSTRIAGAGQSAAITDLHPGDPIFASGAVDEQARTIAAQEITLQQPLAARMFENQRANFGKTWTAGIVTAIQGNSITVTRRDGQTQTFSVDDATAWRVNDRDGSAAMLHAGERIRAQLRPSESAATRVTIQGMTRESPSGLQ